VSFDGCCVETGTILKIILIKIRLFSFHKGLKATISVITSKVTFLYDSKLSNSPMKQNYWLPKSINVNNNVMRHIF
jgi:hypothetical protein